MQTSVAQRRQIQCHFHPFEELYVLMGKELEIMRPDGS